MNLLRALRVIADWRALRDERAWAELKDAQAKAAAAGMRIGEVVRIRQHARTGTKAYVRWIGSGETDAVWVWRMRLRRGQILPVSGSPGHGAHHDEPVFYIETVGRHVGRRTYNGWVRHERRRAASSASGRSRHS